MAKQKPVSKSHSPAGSPQLKAGVSPVVAQLLLTFASVLLIAVLLQLPINQQQWQKVGKYYDEIGKQKKMMGERERMEMRHGENYALPMALAERLKAEDVLLLPPKDYVKAATQNPNNWSNPYMFYYMTDKVRTVPFEPDSLRKKATLAIVYNEQKQVQIVPLSSDSVRKQVESLYTMKK